MSATEIVLQWILSPVVATILLGALVYLFRDVLLRFISERLSLSTQRDLQSRQHQFEQELDEVRRDFERIQSTQQRVLASLLEISSERAKAVSRREIEAAEAIWASVDKLNRLLITAKTVDVLKFDSIEELGATDRASFAKMAKIFTKNLTPEFLESVNCQWTRLYVNEAAWAFYHAYSMILLSGAVRMMAAEWGIADSTHFDNTALKEAILEALPHQKPTFEKFPNIGSTLFLEELRQALITELRKSIHGEQSTEKEVVKARAILDALPKEVPMPGEWPVPPKN